MTKTSEELLWEAAEKGDCATIRALAAMGVDLDARNPAGYTAFNIATWKMQTEAAKTITAMRSAQYMNKIGAPAEPVRKKKSLFGFLRKQG
jgi:hypothetical protein